MECKGNESKWEIEGGYKEIGILTKWRTNRINILFTKHIC
jgi:hypothetical protein